MRNSKPSLYSCGIPREQLQTEKAALHKDLADLNYEIRQIRKDIKLCEEIQNRVPEIVKTLKRIELELQKNRHPVVVFTGLRPSKSVPTGPDLYERPIWD